MARAGYPGNRKGEVCSAAEHVKPLSHIPGDANPEALLTPAGPSDVIFIEPTWFSTPFARADLEIAWSLVGDAYKASQGRFFWYERRLVAREGRVTRLGDTVDGHDRRDFYTGCPFWVTPQDMQPPHEWLLLEMAEVDGVLALAEQTPVATEKSLVSMARRKTRGRFLGVRVLSCFFWHAHM